MGKAVWLGKSEDSVLGDEYHIGTRKGDWDKNWHVFDATELYRFCVKDFERITGFKLEVGECVKVRINVEEVK